MQQGRLLYFLHYNLSVAVWVGLIALAGLDAETGVVMLLYLDHAWDRFAAAGRLRTPADLHDAVIDGAVQRIRPKVMTVCAILFGLLPIMWSPSTRAGADVMKRIAAPMIGGVVTSGILELLLYPAIYMLWRRHHLPDPRRPEAGHGGKASRGPRPLLLTVDLYAHGGLHLADNEVLVEFLDASSGRPLDVGSVKFALDMNMPGMAMHSGGTVARTGEPGRYRVTFRPGMAGDWTAKLDYDGPRGRGSVSLAAPVAQ